jgi:hypothetical protein
VGRASHATIDLLNDDFAAMEAKDPERLGAYYADNITLRFANAPVVTGREGVLAQMVDLLARVRSLAHNLTNVWEEDGGMVARSRSCLPGDRGLPSGEASVGACTERASQQRQDPS